MSKIKQKGFNRSQTNRELPSIGLHTPRHARPHQLSSYLGVVTKEISGNVEYDQMDTKKLNRQQRRLKDILKKMNDDTVKIISQYTPRVKKVPHSRTTTSILAVKEKQTQNNNRILAQCQAEIQSLKERSQILHNHTKQQFQAKIHQTVQQIATVQQIIKEIKNSNLKRGKNILSEQKIIEEGQIKKMENDVYMVEHRAERLRAQSHRVYQEIQQYQSKLKELQPKFMEAERYAKQLQKKGKQIANQKTIQQEYWFKKTTLDKVKKKKDFTMQNCQYRYYRVLKQLEQSDSTVKGAEQKIQQSFISIQASKIAIDKLEQKLKKLRKQKKQREKNINQFLSNTRMYDSRLTPRKMEEGFNGEMPSDIEIKQEHQGDNSAILLQKQLKSEEKTIPKNYKQNEQKVQEDIDILEEGNSISKQKKEEAKKEGKQSIKKDMERMEKDVIGK